MENIKRVFIGYDWREVLPFNVLAHSILSQSSVPVAITAVKLTQLPLKRALEGSTEFSLSRFLVPWLCGYKGHALFMDCDILVRCDIAEIFNRIDGSAVQVVKHDYTPRSSVKFYGNKQVSYPKKNWSSVMLFDCSQCTALTPEYVDTASAMELHQFNWADSVGDLPASMNHLVGEYPYRQDAEVIHWTNGGPWLERYSEVDYAAEWEHERQIMESFLDDRRA